MCVCVCVSVGESAICVGLFACNLYCPSVCVFVRKCNLSGCVNAIFMSSFTV